MKKAIAIVLGLFLSILIFGLFEIFFQLNQNFHWLSPRPEPQFFSEISVEHERSAQLYETYRHNKVYEWKSLLTRAEGDRIRKEGFDAEHFFNLPCCVGRRSPSVDIDETLDMVSRETRTLVLRAHYKTDSVGRRVTPQPQKVNYNILAFGDSFTLGVGVNDEETFPYQLGLLRPEAKVYNLGLGAGSPAQPLYELTQDTRRLRDIPKLKTIVLYTFTDNHLERLFCRSLCLRDYNKWMAALPYYDYSGQDIVFKGFFDLDRPWTNYFYQQVNKSAFLSYFDVVLPPRFHQKHYDFFAELMLAQQRSAKALFPDSEFYVVMYAGGATMFGQPLREAAERKGLKVLDYSKLDMITATGDKDKIEGEGHPSPISQFLMAQLLNKDLEGRSEKEESH